MRLKFALLLAASSVVFSGAAYAQNTASTGETAADQPSADTSADDGTIVVTARRREESLQDVPISITAISGESLQASGISSALDLQYSVPSLSVTTQAPNRATLGYSIRGQRTNEVQLLTDPPVGLYFAEVVMPRPYGFAANFYDLANVQVLKGVQGTLFGRNMTGGAVLVEPAKPDLDEVGGYVQAQYGNYNHIDFEGAVNVPVVEGKFALRVAGKYRKRDGFMTDVSTGRDFDDENFYTLRVGANLDLGGFRNYAVFDYIEQDINGAGVKLNSISFADPINGQPSVIGQQAGGFAFYPFLFPGVNPQVAAGAPLQDVVAQANSAIALGRRQVNYGNFGTGNLYRNETRGGPRQFVRNMGVTNKTEIDIGTLTLKNIIGYREQTFLNISDLDGFAAVLIPSVQEARPRQFSEELQLQGKAFEDRLSFTLGGYYFHEWGTDGSRTSNFPQLTSFGFARNAGPAAPYFLNLPAEAYTQFTIADTDAKSFAVYGALDFKISDVFSISGGLRYNEDKKQIVARPFFPNLQFPTPVGLTPPGFCAFNGVGALPLANCAQTRNLKNDALTWDVTLTAQPSRDLTFYGAVRRGYRAGGFSLRATDNATLAPFQPEFVTEYELGAKTSTRLGAASLNLSAALFYQDYTNVQTQGTLLLGGNVATIITNVGAKENKGGELEANLVFDNGLSFNAFYSYIDIKVKKGDNGTFPNQGVPTHQAGVGMTFTRDFDFAKLTANVNATLRSDVPLDEFDLAGIEDGYALANARIAFDNIGGSNFGLAFFARNIFNKYYRIGVISLLSNGPVLNGVNPGGGVGYSSSVYGDPRTFGVEASFRF